MKCKRCGGTYGNAATPVGNFYSCQDCGYIAGLTYTENKIFDAIIDAHNMFIETKQEQRETEESELIRWVDGIHIVQDVLLYRAIKRTARVQEARHDLR